MHTKFTLSHETQTMKAGEHIYVTPENIEGVTIYDAFSTTIMLKSGATFRVVGNPLSTMIFYC